MCAGYARTTQYLLNRLGIPCTYVTGTTRSGAHGWNLVLADDDWYYLDPTWGDPLFSDGEKAPDYVSYNYFCVTGEELFQTHTPDDTFPLPQCTATACNYFARNGLLLDRYDYDTVLDIMRRAVAQRQDASFASTPPRPWPGGGGAYRAVRSSRSGEECRRRRRYPGHQHGAPQHK